MSEHEPPALFTAPRWTLPNWVWRTGLGRSGGAVRFVYAASAAIDQARSDGISQVEPILAAFRARPDEVKRRIGKAAWRKVHHSPLMDNAWRCKLRMMTTLDFDTILAIPSGALREALGMNKNISPEGFGIAARASRNRTDMRDAVMLVRDMERMRCVIKPAWSLNRLRKEHDKAAQLWAKRAADPTPWREAWSAEIDDYRFTLLRSDADFKAEAMAMHHCIASYARWARDGREIALRVDGKERASASLNVNSHRLELKGPCNRAVSAACRAATWKAFAAFGAAR